MFKFLLFPVLVNFFLIYEIKSFVEHIILLCMKRKVVDKFFPFSQSKNDEILETTGTS